MPRKGLKVTAEVCISAVSCPGVRLPLEHDVFLSICLLGHHVHTRSSPPIFPLVFKEKIKFIKTFPCCSDVQQLDQALREDSVVLELVRDDRICNKMVVLAIYETCAQNFLFPMHGLRPTYSCSDNEIILDPTNDFPGVIGPKVEFSTLTTIKETTCPELDCLKDRVIQIDECRRPCKMTSPCPPCPQRCVPACVQQCVQPCPSPCVQPCPPCPMPCSPCPPLTPPCYRRETMCCPPKSSRNRDYCSACLSDCCRCPSPRPVSPRCVRPCSPPRCSPTRCPRPCPRSPRPSPPPCPPLCRDFCSSDDDESQDE